MKTSKFFGVEIACLSEAAFKDCVSDSLEGNKQIKIAKVNAEFLQRAQTSETFRKTLADFDLKIADGIGVLWAAKYLSLPLTNMPLLRQLQAIGQMFYTGASLIFRPGYCRGVIPESFPGQECFNLMLEVAEKSGKSVYFFGAEKGVLTQAVREIKKSYPKLVIAGFHDGYSNKGRKVIDEINQTKAELLFVALGSPEQEEWILDNLTALRTVRVAVGEGGTFDFIAGNSVRAPKFINRLGLEWIWRLFFSPNRTTGAGSRLKRIWSAVPVFIFNTVKYKIKKTQKGRINVALVYSGGKFFGGIETYILNLFKYYPKEKIKIYLFSLGEWPIVDEVRRAGGEVVIFPKTRFQPFTIFLMAKRARELKISLVASGGLVADAYARAASFLAFLPHLSIIHSYFGLDYPNNFLRLLYGFAKAISAWKTKKYIAVSKFLKEEEIKRGVRADKITVIYNGVEFSPKTPKEEGKVVRIGSMGRLHKVKGYENLIMAMKLVPNSKLTILGEGLERGLLENLIKKEGLTERVLLPGFSGDIWESLSSFDVYVQPSKMEGFGLAVIEAMAAGLPVVVNPVGSMKEIVKDGETGVFTQDSTPEALAASINKLIQDKKLREKISKRAKTEVFSLYEINSWAKKTTDAFLECSK